MHQTSYFSVNGNMKLKNIKGRANASDDLVHILASAALSCLLNTSTVISYRPCVSRTDFRRLLVHSLNTRKYQVTVARNA